MGLPVITYVTGSDGVPFQPAEELRFASNFTVTRVSPPTGPKRLEIALESVDPPVGPTNFIVPQGDVLAAGPATRRFVIAAAPLAAVPIARIQFIPHATTAQSDTVYARFTVEEYDGNGAFARYVVDGAYGTNIQDFTSMQTSIYFTLTGYTLPLGSTVIVEWTKVGGGADVLGGTWIST